jgi:hypothetical protein
VTPPLRPTRSGGRRFDHLAIWPSGYYNGKRNTTTVYGELVKETAMKVRSYCLYNKGTVMEAVEHVATTT